jgi:putative FmdB family regulatory protein
MPTYEYQCEACDERFEVFQSITAKPLRKCPECGKGKVKRLIGTGAGIIFKGSGFYETDYRSDSYKKAEKAEKDAAKPKSDDKKSDTKSESKKTESKKTTPKKPDKNSK